MNDDLYELVEGGYLDDEPGTSWSIYRGDNKWAELTRTGEREAKRIVAALNETAHLDLTN